MSKSKYIKVTLKGEKNGRVVLASLKPFFLSQGAKIEEPTPEEIALEFPETAEAAEDETFAFVYVDACLYNPTFRALEFFFPRMSRGGIIVLTRYEDDAYNGVFQAVVDFEQKYGNLLMLPLGDLTGTMMVIHP